MSEHTVVNIISFHPLQIEWPEGKAFPAGTLCVQLPDYANIVYGTEPLTGLVVRGKYPGLQVTYEWSGGDIKGLSHEVFEILEPLEDTYEESWRRLRAKPLYAEGEMPGWVVLAALTSRS